MLRRRIHLLFLGLSIAPTLPFLAPSAVVADEAARLTYGVPETDAIQVSGVCDATPGTSVKFSIITFGADVGDLKEGTPVDLRFLGGGFHYSLKGEVHGTDAEESISGVLVRMDHDDPLWKVMGEKETLNYLVPGHTVTTLNFVRGRERIRAFVEACRTYAANLDFG
jgi:hypothetical protein